MPVAKSNAWDHALAEARAEGRRQGLEAAAKRVGELADEARHGWSAAQTCAAANEYAERERALDGATKSIRKILANPPKTQKPETGESAP